MAWPQRVLGSDEELLLHVHPHGSVLLRPALVLVAAGAATGFLLAKADAGWQTALLLALAALVVLWGCVAPFLRWRATHLVVTDRRLLLRSGLLRRSGRDLPLSRLDDVGFAQSALQRLVGSGTLRVQTESGMLDVTAVPRVEHVQRLVIESMDLAEPED